MPLTEHESEHHRRNDEVIDKIFQRIDELGKRVDVAVTRVDDVSKRLIDHMHYEDERYADINRGIDKIQGSMHGIVDSMPRDEDGKPSLFVHRQDHELAKEYKSTAKEDRRAFRNKMIDYGILALLIAVATHGETIIKLLIK